jgi:hypothetical protein
MEWLAARLAPDRAVKAWVACASCSTAERAIGDWLAHALQERRRSP